MFSRSCDHLALQREGVAVLYHTPDCSSKQLRDGTSPQCNLSMKPGILGLPLTARIYPAMTSCLNKIQNAPICLVDCTLPRACESLARWHVDVGGRGPYHDRIGCELASFELRASSSSSHLVAKVLVPLEYHEPPNLLLESDFRHDLCPT
jgi:hypothetical protein